MTMRAKKKAKYYLGIDERKGYTQGAFPYTPEGLVAAKEFVRSSSKKGKKDLIIKEKA